MVLRLSSTLEKMGHIESRALDYSHKMYIPWSMSKAGDSLAMHDTLHHGAVQNARGIAVMAEWQAPR